jgi:hypothetical protein
MNDFFVTATGVWIFFIASALYAHFRERRAARKRTAH